MNATTAIEHNISRWFIVLLIIMYFMETWIYNYVIDKTDKFKWGLK